MEQKNYSKNLWIPIATDILLLLSLVCRHLMANLEGEMFDQIDKLEQLVENNYYITVQDNLL